MTYVAPRNFKDRGGAWRHEVCAAQGCGRRPRHMNAALCAKHVQRLQHYGDHRATAIKLAELRPLRSYVEDGLTCFAESPAVKAALARAAALHVKPTRYSHAPRSPKELLTLLLSVYAFEELHPARLPSPFALYMALARVTAQRKRGGVIKAKVIATGKQIHERLGTFAHAFLRHIRPTSIREST